MVSAGRLIGKQPGAFARGLQRGVYVLLFVTFVLSGALIVSSDVLMPSRSKVELKVGDVAPRDLLAPRSLKYESEVLTQAKREAEMARVRPIYDPPDPNVKSAQLQLARQILDYIENVLHDDFATPEQKKADLRAITELSLSDEVIDALVAIEDETVWQRIDEQVMRLLERVMSDEVREDTLQAERDDLRNRISSSFSESEVQIITDIVDDLLRVNAFYNEELTHQAQLEAAERVPTEVRTFAKGQMIIRAGEIATEAHIEALEQFGLLQGTQRKVERLLGGMVLMALVALVVGAYIRSFHPKIYAEPAFLVLLAVLFLLFLLGARPLNAENRVQPYYYPAAALAFLVMTLAGPQLAILMAALLALTAGFVVGRSLEFATLIVLGSTVGVLSLGRTERLNAYFRAGGLVSATGVLVAVFFALGLEDAPSSIVVAAQVFGALANGVLSAGVALVGLYVLSNVLNIPTSLKLVELQQPNHPLLQRLLREAPGTYQHSLQVANLAELGAQRIGANGALVRVAAMYHDVGKILNPHFFVENQADGANPHDILDDPWQSAKIILGHVTEGERLARRYRLPSRVRDFILEHHGTTQVMYFYRKALERAEKTGQEVRIEDFTYPGPRPQSRETAILMLADGCESSVRARRPQSKEDIAEAVDYIFKMRLEGGQLDESNLTLNDLRMLRDTFITALQGIFHPRIVYPKAPEQKMPPQPAPAETDAPNAPPKPQDGKAASTSDALKTRELTPVSERAHAPKPKQATQSAAQVAPDAKRDGAPSSAEAETPKTETEKSA